MPHTTSIIDTLLCVLVRNPRLVGLDIDVIFRLGDHFIIQSLEWSFTCGRVKADVVSRISWEHLRGIFAYSVQFPISFNLVYCLLGSTDSPFVFLLDALCSVNFLMVSVYIYILAGIFFYKVQVTPMRIYTTIG